MKISREKLLEIVEAGRCHKAFLGKKDCACVMCSRYFLALELMERRDSEAYYDVASRLRSSQKEGSK